MGRVSMSFQSNASAASTRRRLIVTVTLCLLTLSTATSGTADAQTANQRLYFMQFNVCNAVPVHNDGRCYGGDSGAAAEDISASVGNASVLTFNEICKDASYKVAGRFAMFQYYIETNGPDSPYHTLNTNRCPGANFGISILSKRALMDNNSTMFTRFFSDSSTTEIRAVTCKRTVYLHTIRVCVTHVTPDDAYRNSNISTVKSFLDGMRNRGDSWATMIGGDFNEPPLDPRMDRMYTNEFSPPGYGHYREVDQCLPAPGTAFGRCGDLTFEVGGNLNRKLDYIFFEAGFCCATASVGTPSVSDHKILRGGLVSRS